MYYKILCLIEFTWLCSGIYEIYMKNKNMLIEIKNWYTYFNIFFLPEKPSFRKAPIDQITMEGKAVHFPCEVVGDTPISVEWRKENVNLQYGRIRVLKDNTLRIEKVEADDAGLYICMARNSVGTAEAVARLTVQCK